MYIHKEQGCEVTFMPGIHFLVDKYPLVDKYFLLDKYPKTSSFD